MGIPGIPGLDVLRQQIDNVLGLPGVDVLRQQIDGVLAPFDEIRKNAEALRVLGETGMFDPERLVALVRHLRRSGAGTGAMVAAAADLAPTATALVDDDGQLSWTELHAEANALAHRLVAHGVTPGDGVALLLRNSRWFVLADCAASRVGARILYMNTGFAGPQFAEVLEREGAVAVLYDDEFEDVVAAGAGDRPRLVGHVETLGAVAAETMAEAIAVSPRSDLPRPERSGGQIILTSGTTGTPKGANRGQLKPDLVTMASMFSRIPHRVGQRMMIAAPMFHAWGLGNYTVALGLGGSMVLSRRFDAEHTMRLVDEHRCDVLAVVPVMLQRILALPAEVTRSLDVSSLRIVASSGAALPGTLATQWMDVFGDNLYNTYGSTEVALATIATPADMRAAPGTAGKPPLGSVVRLYDDADRPVTGTGAVGRIFVGNRIQFEGYTGGGGKAVLDGLMSVGDVGHFDADGRLFVGGRDDDMIISGGENVFPREVEDLLHDHRGVADVAVVGVADDEFGQRLRAFVVRAPGSRVTEKTLKAHVRANLANYKVPRDVVFVDELPRNQSGKILRRELRDR